MWDIAAEALRSVMFGAREYPRNTYARARLNGNLELSRSGNGGKPRENWWYGKSAIGTGLAGLAVLVASPGPPPAIVRNGFRRPDGRRGSGQFAKSALDTLYVARNRGPGWPVPRGNNLFYGCH